MQVCISISKYRLFRVILHTLRFFRYDIFREHSVSPLGAFCASMMTDEACSLVTFATLLSSLPHACMQHAVENAVNTTTRPQCTGKDNGSE